MAQLSAEPSHSTRNPCFPSGVVIGVTGAAHPAKPSVIKTTIAENIFIALICDCNLSVLGSGMASDRDVEGLEQAPESEKARTWYSELSLASDPPTRMDAALIPILYVFYV